MVMYKRHMLEKGVDMYKEDDGSWL